MTNEEVAEIERSSKKGTNMGPDIPQYQRAPTLFELLQDHKRVISEGVAGSGKSHEIKNLKESGFFSEVETVVFHPSTSYEDFVEGLRPDGKGGFEAADGVFLRFAKKAARNPGNNYLFVIDEINRANTAAVLGDLMLVLEGSKSVDPTKAHVILTQYDNPKPDTAAVEDAMEGTTTLTLQLRRNIAEPEAAPDWKNQVLCIPDNLYIYGTMNTTDRSVGALDLALRRRFTIHSQEPSLPESEEELEALGVSPRFVADRRTWTGLNEVLKIHVSPDARLGHSYFFDAKKSTELWKDHLLPQLIEILMSFNVFQGHPAWDKIHAALEGSTFELHESGVGIGRRLKVESPRKAPGKAAGESDQEPATEAEADVV